MSEKGQPRKSMFVVKNMEELRRLYDSDTQGWGRRAGT